MLRASISASNTTDIAKEIARLGAWGKAKGLAAGEIELLCTQAQTTLSDLKDAAHKVSSTGSTFQASRQINTENGSAGITFTVGTVSYTHLSLPPAT